MLHHLCNGDARFAGRGCHPYDLLLGPSNCQLARHSSIDLPLSFDRATHISGFIVTLTSLPFWIKFPCFIIIQISHAVHVRFFFFFSSILVVYPFHKCTKPSFLSLARFSRVWPYWANSLAIPLLTELLEIEQLLLNSEKMNWIKLDSNINWQTVSLCVQSN